MKDYLILQLLIIKYRLAFNRDRRNQFEKFNSLMGQLKDLRINYDKKFINKITDNPHTIKYTFDALEYYRNTNRLYRLTHVSSNIYAEYYEEYQKIIEQDRKSTTTTSSLFNRLLKIKIFLLDSSLSIQNLFSKLYKTIAVGFLKISSSLNSKKQIVELSKNRIEPADKTISSLIEKEKTKLKLEQQQPILSLKNIRKYRTKNKKVMNRKAITQINEKQFQNIAINHLASKTFPFL